MVTVPRPGALSRLFVVPALGALALAAGAWAAWSPAQRLSAPGDVSAARVGIDARGTTTFVWLRSAGGLSRVQTRRRTASGRLGPVVDLSAPAATTSTPALAVAPSGRAVVAWSTQGKTGPAVARARALAANGTPGPVVVLTDAAMRRTGPRVAIDAGGDAVLMWERRTGKANAVMARRWPAGGELGGAVEISEPATGAGFDAASVAVDADGDALFAWEAGHVADGVGTGSAILERAWPRTGPPAAIAVVSDRAEYVRTPRVLLGARGAGMIVWGGYRDDRSASVYLQVRRRSAAGGLGAIHNLRIGDYHAGVALGADGTGYFTGAYDIDPDGEVLAATLSPGGKTSMTTEPFTGGHRSVQIAAGPGRGALLIWSHGDEASVIARSLSAAGKLGAPARVSPPGRPTRQPAIAIGPRGVAQVAWVGRRAGTRIVETAAGP